MYTLYKVRRKPSKMSEIPAGSPEQTNLPEQIDQTEPDESQSTSNGPASKRHKRTAYTHEQKKRLRDLYM